MCPEYNATVSFFPVDRVTLQHFKKTSESPHWHDGFYVLYPKVLLIINHFFRPDFSQAKLDLLESYMKAVKLFRSYEDPSEDPEYSEVWKLVFLINQDELPAYESLFLYCF